VPIDQVTGADDAVAGRGQELLRKRSQRKPPVLDGNRSEASELLSMPLGQQQIGAAEAINTQQDRLLSLSQVFGPDDCF